MMITMTPEEAVAVAGPSTDISQLRPIALADGVTFVLPLAVLDDPEHANKHDLLLTFPQREIAPEEWKQSID